MGKIRVTFGKKGLIVNADNASITLFGSPSIDSLLRIVSDMETVNFTPRRLKGKKRFIIRTGADDGHDPRIMIESKREYKIRKKFYFNGMSLDDEVDEIHDSKLGDEPIKYSILDKDGNPVCAISETKYWFDQDKCRVVDAIDCCHRHFIDKYPPFNVKKPESKVDTDVVKVNSNAGWEYALPAEARYFGSTAFLKDINGLHKERVSVSDVMITKSQLMALGIANVETPLAIDEFIDLCTFDLNGEHVFMVTPVMRSYFQTMYAYGSFENPRTIFHTWYPSYEGPKELLDAAKAEYAKAKNADEYRGRVKSILFLD